MNMAKLVALKVSLAIETCMGFPLLLEVIKVYGYTYRGSNSVIYIFASLLKRSLLSRKELAPLAGKFSLEE